MHESIRIIRHNVDAALVALTRAQTAAQHDSLDPEARQVLHDVIFDARQAVWDANNHVLRVSAALNEGVSA